MSIDFKFSFGRKRRYRQQSGIEKSGRDWKIIIAAFALLIALAGWGCWTLFKTVSSTRAPVGSISSVDDFDNLKKVVDFYKAEYEKYEELKTSTGTIADPSI